MSKLKTYPVDLLGTAPSNKVSGEVRVIERNEDRIFIPTGGPYYTKSLKVWAGATLLTAGVDYRSKELNRNATIDSGKEVCNAIQILNNKATTFTYEYQVIGGDYTELGEELASFIKNTPLGDLTKIGFDEVLYKPLTYPPAPHSHGATDWRGYGDSIWIVDQLTAGLTNGRSSVFNAVKEEAKRRIEAYVDEYIDDHAVVVTDPTPTMNGNVLLSGNGMQPAPLQLQHQALFNELDERYFRNLINPLTRVGAISDNFLPITSGFFNVSSPYVTQQHTSAVAKVERNGDLLFLTPASDGETIRYVYGYVRQWSRHGSIADFKATNQQYRPPGLAADEEIMELMGINNQTMIASIFRMDASGKATFKEHAIVELNDTLIQDSHTLIRLGSEILNKIGSNNPYITRNYRPSFCRMCDGSYYLVAIIDNLRQGAVQVLALTADKQLNLIQTWNGFKETCVVEHVAGEEDRVLSKVVVPTPTKVAAAIEPFTWLKTAAVENIPWIIDNTPPAEGYSFGTSIYHNDLIVHVDGNTIHCNLTFSNRVALYGPLGWLQNNDAYAGASYRIHPKAATPEFYWLRTQCANEEPSSYLVNAEQGYYRQNVDNPARFDYHVPYDMTGGIQDISSYWNSNQIHLSDGKLLMWRPPSSIGTTHYILSHRLPVNGLDPIALMNGYNLNRQWRLNGSRNEGVGPSKINLENPTVIPLGVGAIPMNNGLVLLQEGSASHSGGNLTCNHYIYRPSQNLIYYKTLDLGTVPGYDASDNRKLMYSNVRPTLFVNSRDAAGNCRYSNMSFHRFDEATFTEQVVHRQVYLTYEPAALVKQDPYYLKQLGFDQIEFAINSIMENDRHPKFTSWGLFISPEDPTVALFDCQSAKADGRSVKVIRCAAKLTWSAEKELIGFTLRPEPGQVTDTTVTILNVLSPYGRFWYHDWAIQYNADKTEAHWHGRHTSGFSYPGDSSSSSSVFSYKMTKAADGFPILKLYRNTGHLNGRKMIVTTPTGTGICWDDIAYGIYRVTRPFLNFDWVSGDAWSKDDAKAFVWYTPRATISFKLRVMEDIEVQLGGVHSKIPRGTYELTDPLLSTVTNPKNKVILIYATLIRGAAALQFEEYPLPESIYTTYLGKCVTDEYGVTDADILPISRIGNYRASVTPRGAALSVSSGTATEKLLLNWDADVPTDDVVVVTARINGMDKVSQNQQTTLTCTLTPTDTEITSLKWESLDNTLATVTQSGVVTALKPGRVTIRCTVNDSIVATKGIEIEEVKLITINLADGVGSQPEGGWKVLNPVVLPDKFQEVSGRAPRANEEVRFTVPATYAVTALLTTTPAITVGNWPDNVDLTLVVEGAVLGRGGQGTKAVAGTFLRVRVLEAATAGGPAIVGGSTMLKIINRGIIAGGGGGGGAGRWQHVAGGGGGAPYGLAGSGHYDQGAGGECQPGSFLSGGAGGRMGEGREGGYGGAWGESGRYADANGQNIHPAKAGTALVGTNFIVTNEGAGVVKGG